MRKFSKKNNMLNSELFKTLSILIQSGEVKDKRLSPMASITEATVAPDLKTAKVYVSVLGNEQEMEDSLAALEHASGFLRSRVAEILNWRITPKLTFKPDNSMEYAAHISKLLEQANCGVSNKSDEDE